MKIRKRPKKGMANANGGSRGGKRAFEGDDDNQQNDPKRPALARLVLLI